MKNIFNTQNEKRNSSIHYYCFSIIFFLIKEYVFSHFENIFQNYSGVVWSVLFTGWTYTHEPIDYCSSSGHMPVVVGLSPSKGCTGAPGRCFSLSSIVWECRGVIEGVPSDKLNHAGVWTFQVVASKETALSRQN